MNRNDRGTSLRILMVIRVDVAVSRYHGYTSDAAFWPGTPGLRAVYSGMLFHTRVIGCSRRGGRWLSVRLSTPTGESDCIVQRDKCPPGNFNSRTKMSGGHCFHNYVGLKYKLGKLTMGSAYLFMIGCSQLALNKYYTIYIG